MALAEQAGLSALVTSKVDLGATVIRSAGVNPAGKVSSIVAGMACGADSVDDLDVVRAGGMGRVFGEVYAPATLGQFAREFTHGHCSQLSSVLRAHLVNLVACTDLLPGLESQVFVDIDSLLRPVYGHVKQGASFGHAKVAGKRVLRRGLNPLVTTLSTPAGAPVVSGVRLREGRASSGRSADSMVTDAIRTARMAARAREDTAKPRIRVRGDSAFGTSAVAQACLAEGVEFSLTLAQTAPVQRAIAAIDEQSWQPVHYPGAVTDPDTGALISDAEVAEIEDFTAFSTSAHGPVTARLIVRRVRDRATDQELFPVWRYHPFFTNGTDDPVTTDLDHRRHAIVETVFADLIDGPLAHLPSGYFTTNHAWTLCAALAHNLLRAAGTLTGARRHAVARGATLRRHLITVPARIARPQRHCVLHLPARWPWENTWQQLWHTVFTTGPPTTVAA